MSEKQIKTFDDYLKSRANVDRHTVENELSKKSNRELREIGAQLTPIDGVKYIGSYSTHVYVAPTINQFFFMHQTLLQDVPEQMAQPAITDLRNEVLEFYKRNTQRFRSGF